MVQNKKKLSTNSKTASTQEFDKKPQAGNAERPADAAKAGSMKQADKSGDTKRNRDIGSRK